PGLCGVQPASPVESVSLRIWTPHNEIPNTGRTSLVQTVDSRTAGPDLLLPVGVAGRHGTAYQRGTQPADSRCGLERRRSHHSGSEVWQVPLGAYSSLDPQSALSLRVATGSFSGSTGADILRIRPWHTTGWSRDPTHVLLLVAADRVTWPYG